MRFRVKNQELFYLGVVKKVRVWDYPKNENRAFRWSAGALCFSGVGTHRICLLFCKEIPVVPRRISQVYIHLLCLLFSVLHNSKRHFPNGNRRQLPPCLPKSETDERKSMAAQPFILTIDGVRPFCYKIRLRGCRRNSSHAG